jgi:L-aspartate oxidase
MAAALHAAEQGARVALATAGAGASELAQGGIAAAVGDGDDYEQHAADTLAAGDGLCDPVAVATLTREAGAAVEWLAVHGVRFDHGSDQRPALALEAAHSRPRVLHVGGDRSGAAIVAALRGHLSDVTWFEGVWLERLLVAEGMVRGALLRQRGYSREIRGMATNLATGGFAGLYLPTTTSPYCDGAGLVAALQAGAQLADLEFVQFHPTVYAGLGEPFLVTEALRGAGARLTDRFGRRFLQEVDPRGELAPRAVVTRVAAQHLRETREPHVLLDARHLDNRVLQQQFAGFLANCQRVGLNPEREPVPVIPAAHYTMGGIVTDEQGSTTVPGLYAAGECARTGVHGANRLASNSLLESVVFGRRAAQAALAGRHQRPAVNGFPALASTEVGRDRAERLHNLSWESVRALLRQHAGPLRDAVSLVEGLRILHGARGDQPRAEAARLLASLVLQAGLMRAESRGAHVRTDQPAELPHWGHLQIVASTGNQDRPAVMLLPRQRPAETANFSPPFRSAGHATGCLS